MSYKYSTDYLWAYAYIRYEIIKQRRLNTNHGKVSIKYCMSEVKTQKLVFF